MLDTDPRKLRDRPRAVGIDVMHGVMAARRTTPGRVVAELDGQGRAGDGDGQGLPGVGAARAIFCPQTTMTPVSVVAGGACPRLRSGIAVLSKGSATAIAGGHREYHSSPAEGR
jgi:hypothetical protein